MQNKLGQKKFLLANFGSLVAIGKHKPRDYNTSSRFTNRWVVLGMLVVFFALVLFARLVDLQIIQGSYFRLLADGNRIRHIPIKAARGEILDRNGQVLARNIPVYRLATFNNGGVVEKTEEISREEALKIQASGEEGANRLIIDNTREYPLKEIAAHVVGYVNETTSEEIGKGADCSLAAGSWQLNAGNKYQLSDLIGRMGVEQYYDCVLRGVNGEDLIEVDARGRLVRRLGRKEPIPGKTIKLTLDSSLQKEAYYALKNAPGEKGEVRSPEYIVRGAIIVENPQNGEVLSLVSLPSFDPNTLHDNYTNVSRDKNLPFFNRAIGGEYHPGSTFKIVTSLAALQEGVIDENYKYIDVGFVEAGGTRFRNWLYTRNGGAEGEINIVRAITRSTDTFFYIIGELVGIDNIVKWAHLMGIGEKLGIDLPGEGNGLMPTPDWKIKTVGERWYLGNTYNTSIGQGDVTTTPLQILSMTSIIANSGNQCTPHVLADRYSSCHSLGLADKTLQLVQQGMIGACSPGGTAGQFFNFEPQVACKTGTAEVGNDKTHAWFTAFSSPAEASAEGDSTHPLVVTAIIEEGGEGSTVAAPVVKRVMRKYFEN